MSKQSMYEELGIDPHKAGVRGTFQALFPKGQYPNAFCVITPDLMIPGNVKVKHPDGSGSKIVQRVLHYLETRDISVFRQDTYDFTSMNTSDVAACGFVYNLELTDVIDINSLLLPKAAILQEMAIGFSELLQLYKQYGITLEILGGETADLPDQVRTIVSNADVRSSMPESLLISGNVQSGDLIFGFSSAGKATWEKTKNSGIMANGLTMARKSLMYEKYTEKYPFLCQQDTPFTGKFLVTETVPGLGMTVGEALLSPTRQWAILIRMLIDELKRKNALGLLHGICVNTGGGLTKILNLGSGISYEKTLPSPPPIFKLIQEESGEKWEHMMTTFNCGIGIEIIGEDKDAILTDTIHKISHATNVDSFFLGKCTNAISGKNEVHIHSKYGQFQFTK